MNSARLETAIARYFAEAEGRRTCVRDVELARHVAGELTGAQALEFAEHAARCTDCTATLDDLADTAHAWRHDRRAPAQVLPFPRFVRLFAAPALALAAGLCLFAVWSRSQLDGDRLTPKGTWSLELAVQRGGQQFLAPSGAQLQKGDQLGFFYTSPRDGWLAVLYADDHGAPLRVFPARHDGSAKVTAGQNLPLKDGAVLDDGQGCEWVVGIFTAAPLSGQEAEQLVRQMVAGRRSCALAEAPRGSHADVRVVVVNRSP